MSVATMILGNSGTGKSASLRNMDPAETLLIQVIPKPLPFKTKAWKPVQEGGNVWVECNSDMIVKGMHKTPKPIIVIDDLQYLLATEFMQRAHEKGYEKFTEMGLHYYNVLVAAGKLEAHKRVYLLSHTETTDQGQTQAKLIGKLLSEKITVEGMVTVVLRTHVINGQYLFSTKNNGSDTTKAPMEMFSEEFIPNDLNEVDKAIVNYYGLEQAA